MTGSQTPIRSVIVVSDPYHMRRARWTYRLVLGDSVKLLMAPVPFELSPYRHEWWTDKESRKMVRHEYSKILYYYLKYRLSWGPLKDWLASLDRDWSSKHHHHCLRADAHGRMGGAHRPRAQGRPVRLIGSGNWPADSSPSWWRPTPKIGKWDYRSKRAQFATTLRLSGGVGTTESVPPYSCPPMSG